MESGWGVLRVCRPAAEGVMGVVIVFGGGILAFALVLGVIEALEAWFAAGVSRPPQEPQEDKS